LLCIAARPTRRPPDAPSDGAFTAVQTTRAVARAPHVARPRRRRRRRPNEFSPRDRRRRFLPFASFTRVASRRASSPRASSARVDRRRRVGRARRRRDASPCAARVALDGRLFHGSRTVRRFRASPHRATRERARARARRRATSTSTSTDANSTAMADVALRRCDCAPRRRLEILRAVREAFEREGDARAVAGDAGGMKRIAEAIARGIDDAATHVVVGRGDFNVNLRFAKKSLAYATARARGRRGSAGGKEAPEFRVLVFDSLSLGSGVDGTQQLAFQAMRDEHDEATETAKRRKGSATATVTSDVDGIPRAIVNTVLKVLSDADTADDDHDERASAIREELTRKFGSFWHVVSDEKDFAVASRATELPVQDGDDGEMKRISMRFRRKNCTYEVWHHVAPFDRYGFRKMTWAQKARYMRYFLIIFCACALVWYKYECAKDTHGVRRLVCRALPTLSPVAIGLFIFFVVSAHVDTSAWKKVT
jgi:hypothetical protein